MSHSNSAEWYLVSNIDSIDTPALLVYEGRVKENIRLLQDMVTDNARLRPHVKTNKMAEVCKLLLDAGISKFKCATIAEAEMLAMLNAKDVLLAYQPVGPKISRLINLIKAYPATHFSCLTDNEQSVRFLNDAAAANHIVLPVFIDLNIGMNRTGIKPADANALADYILSLPHLTLAGLHAYDGHIRDSDIEIRKQNTDKAFAGVEALYQYLKNKTGKDFAIVAGGTPTFPVHAARKNVECSPGTFIFTDWGYKQGLPDEAFEYAALVATRVISVIDQQTICTDLGHKSVAAENPLPRVHFLNAPEVQPIGQSEEHLVLKVADASKYKVGDVLYGVPVHICPTVALYEKAFVVHNGTVEKEWKVIARNRYINM
ncbi:MAG: D-TA family PLP-dependent enzyme [Chitinophagaceae bacterium]|nr:D-TA family PLP-dependent enzyme [Chitinophagaceae bacterium]